MRILDVLPRFEAEEQGGRIGPSTMRRYLRILTAYAEWLDPDAVMLDIDPDMVRAYQAALVKAEQAARTIRITLSAIRAFCRWGIRAGLRADDPTLLVSWPRIPKSRPRPLSAAELERLDAALDQPVAGRGRSAWQWQRNVRCVTLMVFGGLRLSDCCGLMWDRVDLGGRALYIYQGKGKKDRLVPMHDRVHVVLAAVPPNERHGPVVGSRSGGAMAEKTMAHIFARWLPGIGIEGIHPHRLRYTCATELRAAGADLKAIQEVLGHESLATTEIYLGPDPVLLNNAIDRLPPRIGLLGKRRRRRQPPPSGAHTD